MTVDSRLEQQYNNRAAVPEHPAFIRSWAERSAEWRQQSAPRTVSYGDSSRSRMDFFAAGAAAPVHVFLHGGYWQALDRSHFSFIARELQRAGECAVIVEYDLCPEVSLGRIVDQVGDALRWLSENASGLGGDMGRLRLTGHSAGAHLLALLLTDDTLPPVEQACALSGIHDLRPLVQTSINRALGLDRQQARDLSPLFRHPAPQQASCQLDLLVGDRESTEYHRQSERLLSAWGDDLSIAMRVVPDCHHFSILDRWLEDFYRPLT